MPKKPTQSAVQVTIKRRRRVPNVVTVEQPPKPTIEKKSTQPQKVSSAKRPSSVVGIFWNCPVCGTYFTSEKTKNKHIQVHGKRTVNRALERKSKPVEKQPKITRVRRLPGLGMMYVHPKRVAIRNACRMCGVVPAMPGDDVCYQCHSK